MAYVTALCLAADPPYQPRPNRGEIWRQVDQWLAQAQATGLAAQYVQQKWWQSLYFRGKYAAAWAKIAELRVLGGSPDPRTLNLLMRAMPEPKPAGD
ncbi:hypothetical protein [Marinicella meishanensis]|uniref:hypothetical protein n=1 Tax=Marinicella meishanensis TaxID=2873263 RepID=UPI001CBC229D|nr:hypothetical protein [Marinicella sp. NBU2979]